MEANAQTAPGRFVSKLTRETLALVMAGGRGTRLGPLTAWRAKPAVPFGGKFRIIDFTLSNCINSGIRQVGVLTQYKSHSLIRHLQQGWSFMKGEFGEFVEILPAQQRKDETSWYEGTADAVFQNLDIIRAHAPKQVLVLAGDHIYKMDYGGMLAHHAETGAQITVGCIEVPIADAREFGVMQVGDDTRIHKFTEKPQHPDAMPGKPDRALASMGIYVFDAAFLLDFLARDASMVGSSHDFGKDVIPAAIREAKVYAYPFRDLTNNRQGYWRDVGTLEAYWRSNLELTAIIPELNLYDEQWPIWTYAAQVPPAKFVFDKPGQRGMALESLVSGGCIISGASVRRSVLFSNVRVETGSALDSAVVLPGAIIGRKCFIKNAVIDEGCVIPDGTVIGESPEADSRRFHRTPQGLVLVTREMLGQEHLVR